MRLLLATLLISLTLPPTGAHAGDAANDAIEEGVRKMGEGDYQAAVASFLRAKELRPTPRTDAQIAIAEQALENFTDAEIHLQDVLDAKDDPWVNKNRKRLEESLAGVRAQLGSLSVTGKPAGANVSVDGQLAGSVPMRRPLRMRIGSVRVYVGATGFVGQSRRVDILAGRTTTVEVDLPRMATPPPLPPPPPPPPPPDPQTQGSGPGPDPILSPTPDPYRSTRIGGWACAIGGAAAVAAGGYLRYWSPGQRTTERQAIGAGLIGAGATALLAGTAVVIGNLPSVRGTKVSLAESVTVGFGGTF